MTSLKLRAAIRAKFAWPGGYPIYGVTRDGAALCVDCMRAEYRQIAYARRHKLNDGWCVEAIGINYEDGSLFCDHCSKQIEAAYV